MKKKILLLIMIFIIILGLGNCIYSKNSQLSKSEKIEDFECLYSNVKKGYPYLYVNKRHYNVDWLENKEKYLKRIEDTPDDEKFIEEMSSIVDDLHNRHTELIDNKSRFELFKTAYSNNNWYDFLSDEKVLNRYNSIKPKIKIQKEYFFKKKLTLEDIIKDKVGYIYLPSMSSSGGSFKEDFNKIGNYIDTLENHEALIIDIRDNAGGSDSYWQGVLSKLIKEDRKVSGYRIYRNNCKTIKKYTQKRNIKLQPIKNLPEHIKKNGPKEILKEFTDFENTSYTIKGNPNLKFKGNIYLLVDEKVFSSSELFSMFCKETKFATVIGESTGGDGGVIDPVLINLKNSGLIIRMASCMYLDKDGICDEELKVIPDYKIEDCEKTSNFKNDNCIKKVLEIEKLN